MIVVDVNVVLAAFRVDLPDHAALRAWLEGALVGHEPIGVADAVLVAVVRLATSARVFTAPSDLDEALAFVTAVRAAPRAVRAVEGETYFDVFRALCVDARATGAAVPDAALAALALSNGALLATRDRGFARWPGLTWLDPLDGDVRRNPARRR